MKASKISKHSRHVRIIRVSRPEVRPLPLDERVDTRILSSVDSWLSSIPSIKEQKIKETSKKVAKQPSASKNNQSSTIKNKEPQEDLLPRKWIIIGVAILGVLIAGSIFGIVLGVILR
ncbi:unnamed protein product [Rotaria sp. Silwood2]|nr:unnamed protein product [Rotaria sp. Silwood2]CAF4044558.1 unnamed protein product [Rotaria sp. Silwood2]